MRVAESRRGEAALAGAELLAGHLGHIVGGARLLTQQKVYVPCCPGCWALHRWGMAAGIAIIAIAMAGFMGFVLMGDRDAKFKEPVWVTFGFVVAFALAATGLIVSTWFSWRATSVLVYRTRDLYYEFWSSDYQEYLKTGATLSSHPPNPWPAGAQRASEGVLSDGHNRK